MILEKAYKVRIVNCFISKYYLKYAAAIPARNGIGIDFSVPSAFLAQVTPKSIPTPLHGAINRNY